jgi:hypothetical protein
MRFRNTRPSYSPGGKGRYLAVESRYINIHVWYRVFNRVVIAWTLGHPWRYVGPLRLAFTGTIRIGEVK